MIHHNHELQYEVPVTLVPKPSPEVMPYIFQNAEHASTMAALNSALVNHISREEELIHRAEIDHITGVRTQRAFREEYPEIVEQAHNKQENLAALFIDLDNFGRVNKRINHGTGDAVLERLGNMLSLVVRAGDIVYRYGGDEFVILMPNFGAERHYDREELVEKASRAGQKIGTDIRLAIREMGLPPELHVGASYGVGLLLPQESDSDFLLRIESYMKRQKAERAQQFND